MTWCWQTFDDLTHDSNNLIQEHNKYPLTPISWPLLTLCAIESVVGRTFSCCFMYEAFYRFLCKSIRYKMTSVSRHVLISSTFWHAQNTSHNSYTCKFTMALDWIVSFAALLILSTGILSVKNWDNKSSNQSLAIGFIWPG